jgi:hypothetical protein
VPDSTSVKIVAAIAAHLLVGLSFTFESGFALCRYRPFRDGQFIALADTFRGCWWKVVALRHHAQNDRQFEGLARALSVTSLARPANCLSVGLATQDGAADRPLIGASGREPGFESCA